jgi:hypothetical protein
MVEEKNTRVPQFTQVPQFTAVPQFTQIFPYPTVQIIGKTWDVSDIDYDMETATTDALPVIGILALGDGIGEAVSQVRDDVPIPVKQMNQFTPIPQLTQIFPYPTVQQVSEVKTVLPVPTTWNVSEVKTVLPVPTTWNVSEVKTVVPMPTTWAVSEVKTVVPQPTTWNVAPVYPNAIAGNLNPSGTATVVPFGMYPVTTPGSGNVVPIGGTLPDGTKIGLRIETDGRLAVVLMDGLNNKINSTSVTVLSVAPSASRGMYVIGDLRLQDGTNSVAVGPTNPVPVTDQSATALEAVTLLRAIATSVAAP